MAQSGVNLVISPGVSQELKLDKNGRLVITIKDLANFVKSGSACVLDHDLKTLNRLKNLIDAQIEEKLFFAEFPEQKIYNSLVAREMFSQKYGLSRPIPELEKVKVEPTKRSWWRFRR